MKAATFAIAVCSGLLAACAGTTEGPANAFRMASPSMSDGAQMTPRMAGNNKKSPNCTGDNISPALEWYNAPAKTRSFALIVDDQAGRAGLGVSHGVVYGIAGTVTSLAEGELAGNPTRFVPGANIFGGAYVGPCPPRGLSPHHYVFTLIATDLEPGALQPGLKRDELLQALQGRALGAASFVLKFNQ